MTEHLIERCVHVRALPATVFSFFTESERFASWWGAGSTIDPRVGGAVRIVYPNGIAVSGAIEEFESERLIVFTYGYEDGKGPVPPGSTRVTIELQPHPLGTLVNLTHAFEDPQVRDAHLPGWRFQLGAFAGVAARAQHAGLDGLFDRFFTAQLIEDQAQCRLALEQLVSHEFHFRDGFACVHGIDEFAAHLQAARTHMGAMQIERRGPVRHCQGTAVCDWLVRDADGAVFLEGSNVAILAPDGRLAEVTGLWEMPGHPKN